MPRSQKNGWIKLHRNILNNPISKKSDYAWLWITLLLKANHKNNKILWDGKTIEIKPGQIISGRKKLASETGISESKIYRILKYLENEQQIKQQHTNKFTIITILNWAKYQKTEQRIKQQMNNKRTTSEQQVNTYKNIKNDKNDKNDKNNKYTYILNLWNSKNIIKHKPLKPLIKEIKKALKKYGEEKITSAIENYNKIYSDPEFYYKHKWRLDKFLKQSNGLPEFLDEGTIWENYIEKNKSVTKPKYFKAEDNEKFTPMPSEVKEKIDKMRRERILDG